MFKRLIFGLLFGVFVGAGVAAVAIKALGVVAFGEGGADALLAYGLAAVTGVLVGLIAGKPIWASDAKIEAGLKAFFGALIASGLFFALRKWLHVEVNLGGVGAGPAAATEIGQLPAIALPLIAGVLGALYEVDNPPESKDKAAGAAAPKASAKLRVAGGAGVAADDGDEAPAPRQAKR